MTNPLPSEPDLAALGPFLYDCVTCGHADPWHSMWPTLGETERACKAEGCECRSMVYPTHRVATPRRDVIGLREALRKHYAKAGRHGTPGMSCDNDECAAAIAALVR